MSSDMVSILERDPVLLAQLASTSEPRSLAEITAKGIVRARRIEAERQIRREREAIERHAYEERRHRAYMEPPAPPAPPSPVQGGVTEEVLSATLEAMVPMIAEFVGRRVGAVAADVARLEDRAVGERQNTTMLARHVEETAERIDAIEARSVLEDAGVWDSAKEYQPGQVVTHHGSAFVCKSANANEKPGASDSWRLLIKKGRDGRDRR